MMSHLNRRSFIASGALAFSGMAVGMKPALEMVVESNENKKAARNTIKKSAGLKSLSPSALFSVLDLELPELSAVKTALDQHGHGAALSALLSYYRGRYPTARTNFDEGTDKPERIIERAKDIGRHVFQWGPYAPADYGPDIDWAADPAGDIEWVAAMYRFYWLADLEQAYVLTGDDQYARLFVDLTTDWIRKHPLEVSLYEDHPVYGVAQGGYWRGYAWLDLQTGIRATNICRCFRTFIHASAVTPDFLALLMASLYDHQVKTEHMPMGDIHNKAVFEQRGFFNVLHTFPEFKDKERWMDIAMRITHETLIAQTTTDGVQREWCGGYHLGVYRDALEIMGRVEDLGRRMPADYQERVYRMADHIFGIATPELAFPMFGDTARSIPSSNKREAFALYPVLMEATGKFHDPKFKALAQLDRKQLPANGSVAFTEAGLYALRNGWDTKQVYMSVHCSPPAISGHDTADNGTFELYAFGRWLMPDSGFYTYGHDKEARAWHRQTRIHATLTVDGKDTNIMGNHRLWRSDEKGDLLCVENHSYRYFAHRRTIWFTNKQGDTPFFVILDEAIGDSKGDISIHFPMAPGRVQVDHGRKRISTAFDDANVLIQVAAKHTVELREEAGWHAWKYGSRERRTSVSAIYAGQGPTVFVSLLVPYKGRKMPDCRILTDPATLIAGKNPVELAVEVAGNRYMLYRKM